MLTLLSSPRVFCICKLAAVSACFAAAQSNPLPIPLPAQDAHGKIKHVVIIMQENRTMDNLFQGYPGADTLPYGYDSNGNQIPLQPVPLEASYDLEHDLFSFMTDYNNGAMNGFNNESTGCG